MSNFYQSINPQCLHAYLITPTGAKLLLENITNKIPVDLQISKLISQQRLRSWLLYPRTVIQGWQTNDKKIFCSDTNPDEECL